MHLAQAFGIGRRVEAHGGKLEIFAAEQKGGGKEEDHHAEAGEQQEWHRHEIDRDGQQCGLDAFDERTRGRYRHAGRLVRIVAALDLGGDLVGEQTSHQRGHRRHQKDRADNDAEGGRDREHISEN